MPVPSLHPAPRSQVKRSLITAVSSSQSFKNRFKKKRLSVFPSTLQARKFHPARPSPTQTPPPVCCPQRGLYNHKESPWVAPGGSSRRGTGSFQGERQKPAGTHQLQLSREQLGKKLGLSGSTAAPLTVKGSTVDGAEPRFSRLQQPRQGMFPVPRTAAGQDGPNWLHANKPIQPHAKSAGSPCPSCARLAVTDPHTEPTVNQGSASHRMPPCQLPASQCLFPSQGAVWDGEVPTAGPSHGAALDSRTPPQQQPSRQHRGLGRGQEVFQQEWG